MADQNFAASIGAVPLTSSASPSASSGDFASSIGAKPLTAEEKGKQYLRGRKASSNEIFPAEIDAIAERHGVSAEVLAEAAPFFGAIESGQKASDNLGALTENFLGESLGFGIPQKLYISQQEDPQMRAALDDLRELAQERKSLVQDIAELGVGVLSGSSIAKGTARALKAAPRALKAVERAGFVGSFGASGLGQSREGDELRDTLGWAALGGGLLGGGIALKKGWKFLRGLNEELTDSTLRQVSIEEDLGKHMEARAPRLQKQEDSIIQFSKQEEAPLRSKKKVTEEILQQVPEEAPVPERLDNYLDVSTPEGRLFRQSGLSDEQVEAFARYSNWERDTRRFAEYLDEGKIELLAGKTGLKKAHRILSERLHTEGEDFLRQEYKRFKQVDELTQLASDSLDRRLFKGNDNWFARTRDFISDGRVVATLIDSRLGTNLVPTMDKLANSQNRFTVHLRNKMEEIRPLVRSIQSSGLDPEDAYRALDTGDFSGLSAEHREITENIANLFENWRKEANELGIPIAKRTNYVPHQTVPLEEYVVRLGRKLDEVESQLPGEARHLGDLTDEQFQTLRESSTSLQEYLHGIEIMQGRKVKSLQDAVQLSEESLNPRLAGEKWSSEASAAKRRTGDIPDFLREKNPLKLAQNWAYETFRHAHLREGLSELKRIRNQAVEAGDRRSAAYLTRLIADLSGVRKGTPAAYAKQKTLEWAIRLQRYADRQDDPQLKALAELTARIPDMWRSLSNAIYPNLLGLNARALLVNLSQPFTMTLPELGYTYGGPKVLRALLADIPLTLALGKEITLSPTTARQLGRKAGETIRTRSMKFILENEGHLAAQWNTELVDVLEKSIETSALYKVPKKTVELWTQASMALYEQTEVINRAVALSIADEVTRDLLTGSSKGAKQFLAKMGRGYQAEIKKALKAQDSEAVQAHVREYLLGRTIFNYNRISMSEFGRTMGPVFSVFTKWPTSIAGDIFAEMEEKGALRGFTKLSHKYLAPLFALLLAQELVLPEPGENARVDKLVGKSQLTGWAPVGSIQSFLENDVLTPPAIDAFLKLGAATVERDPYQFWKAANNAVQSFIPFAGIVRFATQDIPIYAGIEDETRGGTFLNRTFPDADLDSQVRDFTDELTLRD